MSAREGWAAEAAEAVRRYGLEFPAARFCAEHVRPWAYRAGLVTPPPDERAWGAAMTMARRRRYVSQAGYMPAASSHGSPKPAYRVGPDA